MNYELVFVLDPSLDGAEAEKKYQALLGQEGFSVSGVNNLGKRKTAYAVKKKLEAIYICFTGTMANTVLKPLEAKLKLDEKVLRFMVLKK